MSFLLPFAALACKRPEAAPAAVDAGAPAERRAEPAPSAPAPPPSAARPVASEAPRLAGKPAAAGEARRASVDRLADERALDDNAAALRAHFGEALPARLSVQSVELPSAGGGRRLVLVDDGAAAAPKKPLLWMLDAPSTIAWSKDRPIAGITPPVGPIAIAGGPSGRVALAACDPPTSWVALRLWDGDGAPFADFEVMQVERCEALSLFYWPKRGWVVAVARPGAPSLAQLVTESGAMAWGRGLPLGRARAAAAPLSIAADTADTVIVVQIAASAGASDDGKQPGEPVVATRHDAAGLALWPSPVALGRVRDLGAGDARIPLARLREGVVKATLPGGGDVEITSAGDVRRRAR